MPDPTVIDQPGIGWTPDFSMISADTWPGALSSGQQQFASQFGVYTLWALTGRQFGLKALTVRPCYRRTWPLYMTFPALFNPWGGDMSAFAWGLIGVPGGTELVNFACGCSSGSGVCGCSPPEITLPGPVGDVTDVTIDGVSLAPSAYRVDGQRLVRQDGQSWPLVQNLSLPLGNVNTWSVTYTRGAPVPPICNQAAALYAVQVGKAILNQACALPQRVSSVSRQGVSAQVVSPNDYLDKGRTGVWMVDDVIRMFNPGMLATPPRVLSPDLVQFR